MDTVKPPHEGTLKHRACDECRSRKLACSKEADGCSRCLREDMRCHYSQQKPMGRPRKRAKSDRPYENEKENGTKAMLELEQPAYINDAPAIDPSLDSHGILLPSYTAPHSASSVPVGSWEALGVRQNSHDGRAVGHFGADEIYPTIDSRADEATSFSDSRESMSTADKASSWNQSTPSTYGPVCSCLASMYLAMASLQELPSETAAALKTVRAALYAAHTTLRCGKCGLALATSPVPPIEAFQNTMLLGTILPTIVDAYKRLLTMIDKEAESANVLGVRKMFNIEDYGGMLCMSGIHCPKYKFYENADMDPSDWRNTVRALLRTDVYGHENMAVGLVGVIAEMEERQRNRHALLDRMIEHGLWKPDSSQGCSANSSEYARCLRILDIAKVAVKSLIIA